MSKNHYPLEFLEIKYIMNTSINVWWGKSRPPGIPPVYPSLYTEKFLRNNKENYSPLVGQSLSLVFLKVGQTLLTIVSQSFTTLIVVDLPVSDATI